MFGRQIELLNLFGFSVKIDFSWIFIALLVSWSLATGYFPQEYPDLAKSTYWIMGISGMLGLFVSILLHEMSHSVVARRFGIPIRGITLFIFGGVAEMEKEPPSAKSEFWMAIAGPIASVLISAACFGLAALGSMMNLAPPVVAVLQWLGLINGVVVIFNMIPAFPLDGGRVFRAALWHWQNNIRKATRITSNIGSGFGTILIFLGILSLFGGNVIGGIWYALIGMFLRGAAGMSYQQLITRRILEGENIRQFMNDQPVSVSPDVTVADLVENYFYKHHYKMFPVVEGEELVGCVTFRDVKKVDRSEWGIKHVRDISNECSAENSVNADADAMQVLSQLNRTKASRAMVVENGSLVGLVSLKDLMTFLAMKVELEDEADLPLPIKQQAKSLSNESSTN
ncbi:MAG: site-2 protease family protein [Planctomycetaceae bacterium]|nr:site-2 protease family protein [Planctomycetaceae bacterium]